LLVKLKKNDVLLFKFILNVWPAEETFERIQKLELANDGVTVIETLGQDRGEASLKLFNLLTEFVEVILEFPLLDIHDVILDLHELIDSFLEEVVNLEHSCTQCFTFGVSNLNLLKFSELND
jgi:hypothetical protein